MVDTGENSNDTTYKRAPVVLFDDRYPIASSSIAIRSDLENEARRPSVLEKEIYRLDKHPGLRDPGGLFHEKIRLETFNRLGEHRRTLSRHFRR